MRKNFGVNIATLVHACPIMIFGFTINLSAKMKVVFLDKI